jgi:hypothetical protein
MEGEEVKIKEAKAGRGDKGAAGKNGDLIVFRLRTSYEHQTTKLLQPITEDLGVSRDVRAFGYYLWYSCNRE